MSNDFFGSNWGIWRIFVVGGAGLCRIGGVGELRMILRAQDGGRRF